MACALAAALVVQSQPVHAQDAAPAGPIAPDATASAEGRTTAETPQAPIADPASAETPALTEVSPDATPAERMAAGKALYAQRKYVEAARVYDSVGTTNALYNAAMSRAAAGHDAHALLLWTRYLEVAPEDERAEVQESIDAAARLTGEVQFTRSADAAGTRTLALRAAQHLAADELRIPWPDGQTTLSVSLDPGQWSAALEGAKDGPRSLTVVVAKGDRLRFDLAPELPPSPVRLLLNPARALRRGVTVTWAGPREVAERRVTTTESSQWLLATGRWRLLARAPGHDPVEREVEVTARPVELAITLKRDRDSRARLGLGIGLGVTALVVGGVGAFVLHAGESSYNPKRVDTWGRSKDLSSAGVALVAAPAGFAASAITGAVRPSSRITWWTEISVGILALGSGLAVFTVGLAKDSERAKSIDNSGADPRPPPRGMFLAGAGVAGAGASLLASALTGLLVRRRLMRGNVHQAATLLPHGAGYSIAGSF